MDMNDRNKNHIDALSYEQLLSRWRFAACGDPWFQGETGDYWRQRMIDLRAQPGGCERHVAASKNLGW